MHTCHVRTSAVSTLAAAALLALLASLPMSPAARADSPAPSYYDDEDNTALGDSALASPKDGTGNTALGYQALTSNTYGGDNTASGEYAMQENTTGSHNTASGVAAMDANITGSYNTAFGEVASGYNVTGSNNVAVGYQSLKYGQNVTNCVALGADALLNCSGGNNIAVGASAGINLTHGSSNIDIGAKGVGGEGATIRVGVVGLQKNVYLAGVSGVTVAGGVDVVVDSNGHLGMKTSSARFKDDIQPMNAASEAILSLRPVSFRYKPELDPQAIPQYGLVAEEVEKVAPELVARDAEGKAFTVRYEAVNAMLLNEFLKQREQFQQERRRADAQAAEIAKLHAALAALTERVDASASDARLADNGR